MISMGPIITLALFWCSLEVISDVKLLASRIVVAATDSNSVTPNPLSAAKMWRMFVMFVFTVQFRYRIIIIVIQDTVQVERIRHDRRPTYCGLRRGGAEPPRDRKSPGTRRRMRGRRITRDRHGGGHRVQLRYERESVE